MCREFLSAHLPPSTPVVMSGAGDEEPFVAGGLLYQENDVPLLVTVGKSETDGESRCIDTADGGSGEPSPVTVENETDGESRCISATDGGRGEPFPVAINNETFGKSRCFDATDGGSGDGSGSGTMCDNVVASPRPSTGTPGSTCDCRRSTVLARRNAANVSTIHVAAESSGHRVESPTVDVAAQSSDSEVIGGGWGGGERQGGGAEGAGNGGWWWMFAPWESCTRGGMRTGSPGGWSSCGWGS